MQETAYAQSVEAWRSALDADLRREDGLLALRGLYWLQKGISTVGSSPDCSICLPKPISRLLGAFNSDGSRVSFQVDVGQVVEVDGQSTSSTSQLRFEEDRGGASYIRIGDISMKLIRHASRIGVQVFSRANMATGAGTSRSWFDIDQSLRMPALYTPYPAPVRSRMPDATGAFVDGYVQGYVSFRYDGKSHNLDAAETQDGRLFLQFRDRSNGAQTYAEGRYLQTETVSEDGAVLVDFNKAYNPPAAFSAFTACTLAPRENALRCAILAGERSFQGLGAAP